MLSKQELEKYFYDGSPLIADIPAIVVDDVEKYASTLKGTSDDYAVARCIKNSFPLIYGEKVAEIFQKFQLTQPDLTLLIQGFLTPLNLACTGYEIILVGMGEALEAIKTTEPQYTSYLRKYSSLAMETWVKKRILKLFLPWRINTPLVLIFIFELALNVLIEH